MSMANSHAWAINIEEADTLYPSGEKKGKKESFDQLELKGWAFFLLFVVCL